MKKVVMCIVFSLCFILFGCGSNSGEEITNIDNEAEAKSEFVEISDVQDEYYKLSVQDESLDTQGIMIILLNELYDRDAVKREQMDDRVMYSFQKDGNTYKWWSQESSFWYALNNEKAFKPISDMESAKDISDEIMQRFGKNISSNVQAVQGTELYEGGMHFVYVMEYEGVEILGQGAVKQENEMLNGTFFRISIDDDGLRLFYAQNLIEITDVLDTYSTDEFISTQEVYKIVESYNGNIYSLEENVDCLIDSIKVIYVPQQEENEKVLIPAYQVTATHLVNEEKIETTYYIDVFNGYVYNWGA